MNTRTFLILLLLLASLSGCAGTGAKNMEAELVPTINMLREKRAEYAVHLPSSAQKLDLGTLESALFKQYFQAYVADMQENNLTAALENLRICQEIYPQNTQIQIEMNRLQKENTRREISEELSALIDQGKDKSARIYLEKLPVEIRQDAFVQQLEQSLQRSDAEAEMIELNLQGADIKDALMLVAASFGINVVFDNDIRSRQVSFMFDQITFVDAIHLLTRDANLAYIALNENTLLFYPNDDLSHDKYTVQYVESYYLNALSVKEMSSIIKSIVPVTSLTISESMNLLIVKADASTHAVIRQIIEENDKAKAEVLLEVEILEVNRTEAERLGLDYGSYEVGVQAGTLPLLGDYEASLRQNGTITIPSFALSAFKQDVDAKTLSSPRIRVIDGRKARIHIGDQVPLRSSSITESTGQTKTTYEYRDTGIRLEVTPKIFSDDSVQINMQLEVSSLGENLGTTTEPAYRIGTRVADTSMVLQNGESAVLAGLISEQDQASDSKVPLLSRIPLIRSLFQYDDSRLSRTDVLLSITPIVLRKVGHVAGEDALPVGTRKSISSMTDIELEKLKLTEVDTNPQVERESLNIRSSSTANNRSVRQAEAPSNASPASIGFETPEYHLSPAELVMLPVLGSGLPLISETTLEVAFNPSVAEFLGAFSDTLSATQFESRVEENRIFITIRDSNMDFGELFSLQFRAKAPGTSFIIFRPSDLVDSTGKTVSVDFDNTKLRVK